MRHEFALYSAFLSLALHDKKIGQTITIVDENLWHRLKHVIRIAPGVQFCIFDQTHAVQVTFSLFILKNQIQVVFDAYVSLRHLTPKIIVLLPLLKREALADALYSCVELGAHHVQLVITKKSQHAWTCQRDRERYEKIMIAASEQSKQFVLPTLADPVMLPEIFERNLLPVSFRVHCDPQGALLWHVIEQVRDKKDNCLVISIGPEGDLTDQERAMLYKHAFVACALTPTVLRASQALVVALGAFRSSSS